MSGLLINMTLLCHSNREMKSQEDNQDDDENTQSKRSFETNFAPHMFSSNVLPLRRLPMLSMSMLEVMVGIIAL